MADTVRYFMEEMVPELEDLEEKGYFTRAEIRDIVRKREKFEYALKRKTPAKADFLRYIEYETGLNELMKLRKVSNGIKANIGKGELGSVKRCHMIYERATRKFRGDICIWLSWLEYCKASNSMRQMSRTITKALQYHPNDVGLWIYASAWEFEHNKNTTGARSLMQQALRISKNSEQLWTEYLHMELVYAQKLRARQKVLGIGSRGKRSEDAESSDGHEPEVQLAEEDKGSLDIVIRGDVARIVLKNALENVPDSLQLRLRLLEVLEEAYLPGVEVLAGDVFEDLEAHFRASESAWNVRARRSSGLFATSSEALADEPAIAVYEAAIGALPSAEMFDLYATFLLEQADWKTPVGEEGNSSPPDFLKKGQHRKAARRCLALYKKAAEKGALSQKAALIWPRLALACGKVGEALSAAEAGCEACKQSAAVWSQSIILASQQALQQGADKSEAFSKAAEALIMKGVTSSKGDGAVELWELAFEMTLRLELNLELLIHHFQQIVAEHGKGQLRGGLGAAAATAIRLIRQKLGLKAARDFYRPLLRLPPAGGSLYQGIISLELSEEDGRLPASKLRTIFEAAVESYGELDTDLWLLFAQFERDRGQGVGKIYWRATKMLEDPSIFMASLSSPNSKE